MGISIPGVVESEKRKVCSFFQTVRLLVLSSYRSFSGVDDEMVQLCVVLARYGRKFRKFKPRKDGMFRRLGRVDLYQRQ